MKRFRSLLLAVASLPFAISAQTLGVTPKVTDANALVAPLQYHSAFEAPTPALPSQSPDKAWVRANRDIARPSEHAMHGNVERKEKAPQATTAAQTTPPVPPASDAHQGHHMHMKGQ